MPVRIGMVDTADRRPLDRPRRELRLVLAARLHAAVAARLGSRSRLQRPREGSLRLPRPRYPDAASRARFPLRSTRLSPDGRTGIGCNFSRLWDVRPGYGYPGLVDPDRDDPTPDDSGVYSVDLQTGEQRLLVSVAQVLKLGQPFPDWGQAKHYFIHLLFSPDGKRFIFLHRWRTPQRHAGTRMFTAAADGSDLRLIDANGLTSHFIWRDERYILAWSDQPSHGKRFYLFDDRGEESPEPVGPDVMLADGHCTYLPGNKWILNDTYPGPAAHAAPVLVRSGDRPPRAAGPLSFAARIHGRMARRYAPAVQPRRQEGRHRLAPRRQRAADVPDRHRRNRRLTSAHGIFKKRTSEPAM